MKLDCLGALELLDRKRHGISPEDAAWLDAHLRCCARCRGTTADQLDTQRLMDLWPPMSADPEHALPAIRARIAQENIGRASVQQMRLVGAGIAIVALVGIAMTHWLARVRSPAFQPAAPMRKAPAHVAQELTVSQRAEPPRFAKRRGEGESRCQRRYRTLTSRRIVSRAPMPNLREASPAPISRSSVSESRFGARVPSADEAKDLARFFLLPPPDPEGERLRLTARLVDEPANGPEWQEAGIVSLQQTAVLLQLLAGTAQDGGVEPPPPIPPPYEAAPPSPTQSGFVHLGGWS